MIIRQIESEDELKTVLRMTHDAYVNEGYIQPQPDSLYHHYKTHDSLPDTAILIAIDNNQIVGTVSACNENHSGTSFENDFPEVAQNIKKECEITGKNLAYVYRIVTLPDYRNNKMITMILHSIIEYLCKNKTHITLIIINPKHVDFYERMLGFRKIAIGDTAAAAAPGVVMEADMRHVYYKWIRIAKRQGLKMDFEVPFWPAAYVGVSWWRKILDDIIYPWHILAPLFLFGVKIYDYLFPIPADQLAIVDRKLEELYWAANLS